ncbi:elongation factor P maturation arginine rhamnosyltransferase EarP [Ideonella sp. B7]|uniref:elongation factor P maturation arginine rhamnosyltransferase EarP n=1 Tax=Ideonella benzenivorans TaxID=2831643 RepID=UPI001CEC0FC0|nr:elongation factor P maturation arginine rhamnosyltransferase EarP [Ideonella benzenivorans]MCA6217857.1 elongation factor P maturation arginine rhamnosyltransferase EarP [Ideonella benzenivorans]
MPAPSQPPVPPAWCWDLFCRVIDNYGDIGVCWRLAVGLAEHGQQVRLWVDDPQALQWMAPAGHAGVAVQPWTADTPLPEPGDVVVEAFGCDPPESFVARMAAAARPPVWVNLEYLSAEPYVERSHRLRSPQRCGLDKWFFYPGFTPATGGLLREEDLLQAQAGFDAAAWRARQGIAPQPGERLVSLFCYPQDQLPALLAALGDAPTLLLTAPGPATTLTRDLPRPPGLRLQALPWLSQPDYDRLQWACDLNLVRGEDSFVRAQWAGRPFLWQIYPQEDGVHADKLAAFLTRHLEGAPAPLASTVAQLMRAWNGLQPDWPALPPLGAWAAWTQAWRTRLLSQPPLVRQLLDFVMEKR